MWDRAWIAEIDADQFVFAAGGLANLYYPRADRGLGLTLGDGFVSIAGHAADNVIREFLLRRLTPNVPGYARGKQ